MDIIDYLEEDLSFSSEDDEYLDDIIEDDYWMFGGEKVPSYDEKNYDKGILRKCLNIDAEVKDRKFKYVYAKDEKEVGEDEIKRIKDLKIPMTWGYVWISIDPTTKIQVIGIDGSGKKQYLYNKSHKKELVEHKFGNLNLLVKNINKLHKLIDKSKQDAKGNYYDKHYILSTIIKIILITGIRAGKEFYARTHETYGITSLRSKHVIIKDDYILLKFKGKSDVIHEHKITDKEVVEHLKALKKLCKNEDDKIFQYKKKGEIKKIDEFSLNNYLHKYLHPKIVIKDLRTYLVNYLLISNLMKSVKKNNIVKEKDKVKVVKECIKKTAEFIQHTVAVCKSNYIDQRVIEKFNNDIEFFKSNKKVSDLLVEIVKDGIIIE